VSKKILINRPGSLKNNVPIMAVYVGSVLVYTIKTRYLLPYFSRFILVDLYVHIDCIVVVYNKGKTKYE